MKYFSDSDGESTADGQNELSRREIPLGVIASIVKTGKISRRESVFAAKRLTKL